MVRLVIDTDPGVDDAHAILTAFAHTGTHIEAITTVAGNVGLEHTSANALKILDVVGKTTPVYAGCSRALVAVHQNASNVHGADGLGDSGIPASKRKLQSEHAVNALVRLANEAPGELTLAAIGPLTNVAMATRLDPDLPNKYKRLVLMGGAIHGHGNTTPSAEFNVFTDPEAAAVVFEAWKGLTLVSWETTTENGFNEEQVNTLLALQSPRADFFRKISAHTLAFIQGLLGHKGLFGADLLAVAAAIEPEIVTRSEVHHVSVELAGANTRGQTVVDWMGVTGQEANVNLALEFDRRRLWELLYAGLK
jgi:purine nucleosidase